MSGKQGEGPSQGIYLTAPGFAYYVGEQTEGKPTGLGMARMQGNSNTAPLLLMGRFAGWQVCTGHGVSSPENGLATVILPQPSLFGVPILAQWAYVGEWYTSKPHGLGVMVTEQGVTTWARFTTGAASGPGVQTRLGLRYEGELENGQPHGYGMMHSEVPYFVLSGRFEEGKPVGLGTALTSDQGPMGEAVRVRFTSTPPFFSKHALGTEDTKVAVAEAENGRAFAQEASAVERSVERVREEAEEALVAVLQPLCTALRGVDVAQLLQTGIGKELLKDLTDPSGILLHVSSFLVGRLHHQALVLQQGGPPRRTDHRYLLTHTALPPRTPATPSKTQQQSQPLLTLPDSVSSRALSPSASSTSSTSSSLPNPAQPPSSLHALLTNLAAASAMGDATDHAEVVHGGEMLLRLLSLLYEMSSLVPEAGAVEASLRARLRRARQDVLDQAQEEGINLETLHASTSFEDAEVVTSLLPALHELVSLSAHAPDRALQRLLDRRVGRPLREACSKSMNDCVNALRVLKATRRGLVQGLQGELKALSSVVVHQKTPFNHLWERWQTHALTLPAREAIVRGIRAQERVVEQATLSKECWELLLAVQGDLEGAFESLSGHKPKSKKERQETQELRDAKLSCDIYLLRKMLQDLTSSGAAIESMGKLTRAQTSSSSLKSGALYKEQNSFRIASNVLRRGLLQAQEASASLVSGAAMGLSLVTVERDFLAACQRYQSLLTEHSRTLALYRRVFVKHARGSHEHPRRMQAVLSALGELHIPTVVSTSSISDEAILTCHSRQYLDYLTGKVSALSDGDASVGLSSFASERDHPPDTMINASSLMIAKEAAATVCEAVDQICKNESPNINAFCCVRPPGHHAGVEGAALSKQPGFCEAAGCHRTGFGFCLLNNVTIGAFHALRAFPDAIGRVVIVDIDLHHGNGTEDIIEARGDGRIMLVSIHVGSIYPETGRQAKRYTGRSDPTTAPIVSIPLPEHTRGPQYIKAFQRYAVTAINAFEPDLMLVSAGFDGHENDMMAGGGGLQLKGSDFATISRHLVGLAHRHCGGRIVSVLEGGYGREKDDSDDEDEKPHKKQKGGMLNKGKRKPQDAAAVEDAQKKKEGADAGEVEGEQQGEPQLEEDTEEAEEEIRMAKVDEDGYDLESLLDGAKSHCGALRDGARALADLEFNSFIEAGYPLLEAVHRRDQTRVLEILQDRTDDVQARCKVAVKGWARGSSVLHVMCATAPAEVDSFSHAIVSALVAHGADINARDEHGWTPTHLAAYHISTSAVNLALLDFFFDSFGQGSALTATYTPLPSALEDLSALDGIPCGGCGHSDDDGFLLCDHPTEPDHGMHMQCLLPPLLQVPDGDWFCPEHQAKKRGQPSSSAPGMTREPFPSLVDPSTLSLGLCTERNPSEISLSRWSLGTVQSFLERQGYEQKLRHNKKFKAKADVTKEAVAPMQTDDSQDVAFRKLKNELFTAKVYEAELAAGKRINTAKRQAFFEESQEEAWAILGGGSRKRRR